ncbi:unnamed protein product [Paramecium octaurelia]|uniref:Uncharacterized protein n=1 Tax=Paramecium octaurelia TaxID=43137 RepID=A0A8S1WFJ4_PAROT|nr:unnamed protein product [Paramecium octaurelia]
MNQKSASKLSNFIREIIQKMAFCQLPHFQYSRYNIYQQISVKIKLFPNYFKIRSLDEKLILYTQKQEIQLQSCF